MIIFIVPILCLVLLLLLFRVIFLLYKIQSRRSNLPKFFQYDNKNNNNDKSTIKKRKSMKTLIVFGSGGHTSEMLSLIKNLPKEKYSPYTAIIANTDTTSESRIRANNPNNTKLPDIIYHIPRSREVGQSYISSIITTFHAIIYSIYIICCTLPDLVICNGPGTCLPIIFITFVFRCFGLCFGNIVFVESFCRVQSLSLTGKLVFPIVDRFIVHWSELQKKYPKCELIESFVKRDVSSSSSQD